MHLVNREKKLLRQKFTTKRSPSRRENNLTEAKKHHTGQQPVNTPNFLPLVSIYENK